MAFLKNKVFFAALALLALAAVGWLFLGGAADDGMTNVGDDDAIVSRRKLEPSKAKARTERGRRAKSGAKRSASGVNGERLKSVSDVVLPDDPDEFRELTKAEIDIIRDIRAALDAEDLPRLRKVIAKFQLPVSEGGLGGKVHLELRQEAVAALRWFSPKSILDLLPYIADVDTSVVEETYSGIEEALDDGDVGDVERAEILVSLLQVLDDSDRIDTLLMTLNNMRNSVKAGAIMEILKGGTPEAKAVMLEQVGFYTDADVEDSKGVETWIKENPDDPSDEETYGGAKPEEEGAAAK